jgi:CO/xanthine dehydrogenase Mo-binding subunit
VSSDELDVVGRRRPRMEGPAKAAGAALYVSDLAVAGLLHGRVVPSPYAHASILSIDASAALELPGVVAVLVAADLPIEGSGSRSVEPLARDEVLFAGQPVALVVAETEAQAEDAVEAVVVEYAPLPVVVDVEQALAAGSPAARLSGTAGADAADMAVHGEAAGAVESEIPPASPNFTTAHALKNGDVDAALAGSAAVAEGVFRTSWVHQGYLEPQAAVAWVDPDGTLVMTSSTQGASFVRAGLSRVLGLPLEKVKLTPAVVGGGFGGKIGLIEPLVGAAALAVRRPIRVAFTRTEDFAATNPAPGLVLDVKVGMAADGSFTAIRARVLVDEGAYGDFSPAGLIGARVGGGYTWPVWDVEVTGVKTNKFGGGAYRGPTATQCTFALEQLVDELTSRLGLDPFDVRLRNAPVEGAPKLDGVWPGVGVRETLELARQHPLWQKRSSLPDGEGIGLGFGLFPGGRFAAGAVCRMEPDGSMAIITGMADITGTATAIAAIAAETLGISFDQMRVNVVEASAAPQTPVSGGSAITYSIGKAVEAAALDARDQILRVVADELEIAPADLEIVDGVVRPVGSPDRGVAFGDIARRSTGFGNAHAPIEGRGATVPADLSPSACVNIVHVRVDRETGVVQVLDIAHIQDTGRSINPTLCEGQMRGGVTQSIGYALFEELVHDEDAQLSTPTFLGYTLPRAEHLPAIDTVLVEVPSRHGPLGAKGIGESAIVPGAAATANAIHAATGIRFRSLPITPSRLWAGMQRTA